MKAAGKIVLASGSPRRKEMFGLLGIDVEVIPSDIAEVGYGGEPPHIAARMTKQKVRAVRSRLGPAFEGWVVGADTVVALDQDTFGKPRDAEDARTMLRRLSGKTHQVYSAYRIEAFDGEVKEGVVATDVTMAEIRLEDLEWYISTGEPFDKAGGYAIQGKGGVFVTSIKGSYSNVVGLPLFEVVQALRDLGAIV